MSSFEWPPACCMEPTPTWLHCHEVTTLTRFTLHLRRMVASFIIKEPESGIAAYRQVYRLSSLSCETLTAVLAAVAASVRSIDAAFRSQAGNRIPDAAIVLAGRNRPPSGSASLVWQVPQLAALRERRESPAFGPGGSGDNQGAIAPTFRLAVTGRVPVAAGQEAPIALAAAFQYAQFPIVGGTNTATSLYLVAAFKEECPPGTAAAVRTTVQLLNQVRWRRWERQTVAAVRAGMWSLPTSCRHSGHVNLTLLRCRATCA